MAKAENSRFVRRVNDAQAHLSWLRRPGQSHVVALVQVGKSAVAACNSFRPHAGSDGYGAHAEVAALSKVHPNARGKAVITVLRFRADGTLGEARPCQRCQRYFAKYGVTSVYHSTRDGSVIKFQKDR